MHSDFSVFKIKSGFLSEFQSDPSMSEESLQFSLHHMKKKIHFLYPECKDVHNIIWPIPITQS